MWDKRAQRVKTIDIAVPLDKNIQLTYTTKIQKCGQLKHKVQKAVLVNTCCIFHSFLDHQDKAAKRFRTYGRKMLPAFHF